MDDRRRGFGLGEILLVGVALCVMIALGIAAASAFTQPSVPDPQLEVAQTSAPPPTPLQPVVPQVEEAAPAATGSRISAEWVTTMAGRSGIGETALQAYGSATLRLSKEQPACRLGWTTLAGIGGIESLHGTDKGAYLLADGTTSQPILGPALDGTDGNAAIRSTAESIPWHGDTQWDHAVGPMQFIPSTWEQWGTDADGDGVADPNDIDDAAGAAVAYLCADGHDLTSGAGWADAVFGYNHDQSYVDSVYAAATAYASRTT